MPAGIPVRVVLGDDRVPDRDLCQYRLRADRRPDRRDGAGRLPAGEGHRRADPPGGIDLASLLTGLGALAILVAGPDPAGRGQRADRVAIPTIIVVLAGADSVARVGDSGAIPRGVPLPHLPDLRLFSFSLVTGALAVAAIVLVQGAGVAEAAPNEDGTASDANRDIIAQG